MNNDINVFCSQNIPYGQGASDQEKMRKGWQPKLIRTQTELSGNRGAR